MRRRARFTLIRHALVVSGWLVTMGVLPGLTKAEGNTTVQVVDMEQNRSHNLANLEYLVAARLLSALGYLEKKDDSTPWGSEPWDALPCPRFGAGPSLACTSWKLRIVDEIRDFQKHNDLPVTGDLSDVRDRLRQQALRDAYASYRLCEREWMIEWCESAARHYRQLAQSGDAEAQYRLARVLTPLSARNISASTWSVHVKNEDEITKWYERAAEQGHIDAQFQLATRYWSPGLDVPPDYVLAYKWYTLSIQGLPANTAGAKNIVEHRDAVAEKMTPQQIANAQGRAREWLELHPTKR
jgi:TPR repeat protein